ERLRQRAVVLFTSSALLCRLAQSTGQLIACRASQGLGMGASQVLVQVVIATLISPKERGKLNGYIGSIMGVATVGGPLLGGMLAGLPWGGWRWCFLIGVPFMLVA